MELAQLYLKEILHYCPETGVFTWRKKTCRKVVVGKVAGNNSMGYIHIRVSGRLYRAHRLAYLYMTGHFPEKDIDHINQDGTDNRWSNIRAVNHGKNMKNQPMRRTNKSGCTGVFWLRVNKRWMSSIRVNNKSIHIGCFTDWFEAVCARKSAELKHGFHINHGR